MKSAEALIGHDCFKLQQTITNLWKARLDPLTADQVLASEGDLWSALGSLKALVEDVRGANDEKSNFSIAAE